MNQTLMSLANNFAIGIVGGILVILLSGITAFLANKNIAVFNDGIRPLVGQKLQGNLKYRALAGMSFAMSIGYVVGFIPFSVASNILVMHTILLGSEMIGLMFNNNKKYLPFVSAGVAMAYGGALYWGLQYLSQGINEVSYPGFGFDLGMIVDGAFPFIFAMFPTIAVYLQSGWKKGLITLVVSVATYVLISLFGWKQANLYPMAITLLVGSTMLFGFAIHEHFVTKKSKTKDDKKETLESKFEGFSKNVANIKGNKWYFVVSGAIASMTVTSFAASPLVSMALQTKKAVEGDAISALIADTTWVIGFIPLVVLTALLTGVYSPVGLTAVFVWGDLAKIIGAKIVASTGNEYTYFIAIALAGGFGGLSLFAETYLLKLLADILIKIPGIQKLADSMRTGITKTINYAFLMGGVISAFVMGQHVAGFIGASGEAAAGLSIWLPSLGAGLVLLLVAVNTLTKHKLAEVAVGPLGALIVGVLFNVIYFVF